MVNLSFSRALEQTHTDNNNDKLKMIQKKKRNIKIAYESEHGEATNEM